MPEVSKIQYCHILWNPYWSMHISTGNFSFSKVQDNIARTLKYLLSLSSRGKAGLRHNKPLSALEIGYLKLSWSQMSKLKKIKLITAKLWKVNLEGSSWQKSNDNHFIFPVIWSQNKTILSKLHGTSYGCDSSSFSWIMARVSNTGSCYGRWGTEHNPKMPFNKESGIHQ